MVGPSHSSLPKVEPNVGLFSYSTYQPQSSYMHDIKVKSDVGQPHKSLPSKSGLAGGLERDHHGREVLQNPPSLLQDHKSSVIVKNEGRELPKVAASQQHSSSPKIMPYLNVQSVPPQHKPYEYRSPTQSPHHLHHLDGLQTAKSIPQSHHRSSSGSTTTTQLPSSRASTAFAQSTVTARPASSSATASIAARAALSYQAGTGPTLRYCQVLVSVSASASAHGIADLALRHAGWLEAESQQSSAAPHLRKTEFRYHDRDPGLQGVRTGGRGPDTAHLEGR